MFHAPECESKLLWNLCRHIFSCATLSKLKYIPRLTMVINWGFSRWSGKILSYANCKLIITILLRWTSISRYRDTFTIIVFIHWTLISCDVFVNILSPEFEQEGRCNMYFVPTMYLCVYSWTELCYGCVYPTEHAYIVRTPMHRLSMMKIR